MEKSQPSQEELKSGIARAIFEQQKITGLDLSSPNFKKDLEKLDLKKLDNIVIDFDNQTTNAIKKFKIDGAKFIDILKTIDNLKLAETFKTKGTPPVSFANKNFSDLSVSERTVTRQAVKESLSPQLLIPIPSLNL